MATVRPVVLPHQEKKDGTWNVKIIVTVGTNKGYIETQHFVTKKQLRKDFSIKDQFVLDALNPVLAGYRKKISELGDKLSFHTAKSLTDLLKTGEVTADTINFFAFGWAQIELINNKKRKGCAGNFKAVLYGLQDFFKSDRAAITEITSKMLSKYEQHLRSPREVLRPDQFGRMRIRKTKGVTDGGLHNHMRDLRTLFNDAVKFYNNKETGLEIIKHYPFENYKIVDAPESYKPKLTVAQVKQIRDIKILNPDQVKAHKKAIRENADYENKNFVFVQENSREHQAVELAMLSFYLCGMNAVDLYHLPAADASTIHRLNYNRSKTRDRRKDHAFISLHIPDVALGLYVKYAGKLQQKYSKPECLDQALSRAMKLIGEKLGIEKLWFYDLRHAFADQARNMCGFSKDDVAAALNHKDNTNSVTDKYISKNWTIIDKVQKTVISLYDVKRSVQYICNESPMVFRTVGLTQRCRLDH